MFQCFTYEPLSESIYLSSVPGITWKPKVRFEDSVKDTVGLSIARVFREAQDGGRWSRFCKGATVDLFNDPTV